MTRETVITGRRSIRRLALGILAIGLAVGGQLAAQEQEYPADALVLFGAAAALLLWAFRSLPSEASPEPAAIASSEASVAEPHATLSGRSGRFLTGLPSDHLVTAAVALCIVGLILGYDQGFTSLSVLCWVASVALGILAAAQADGKQRPARAPESAGGAPPLHWEITGLLGLTALAAFLRLYQLDSLPSGLWYDEAQWGLDARSVGKEGSFPVYFPANFGHPFLFIYLIAGLFRVLGESALVLRLAASLVGIATVPVAYWFGKELFGWRAGLLAAFLIAVSRWHINFSRIAFDAIEMPLFQLLGFYFLARAWRTGRRLDFALSGVFLGLGLYSYAAFRLVPLLVLFYLAHLWLTTRPDWRRRLWDVALAALVFLMVAAPLAQYALRHPEIVNARVEAVSIFAGRTFAEGVQTAMENTRKHLLMFNAEGDHNGRHNLPGEPMLDPGTAALLVLGTALALCRWRRPQHLLLLAWAALGLAGGIFALDFEAPQGLRSIGSLPAVLVLAALPLALLWEEADRVVAVGQARRVIGGLAAVGLAAILAVNYHIYFNVQARDFAVWNAFSTPESITAREMKRLGEGWRFYVISLYAGHPTTRFLAPGVDDVRSFETTDTLPLPEDGSSRVALFLDDERKQVYEEAKKIYPHAQFQEYGLPGGPVVLYSVLLQPPDITRIQGLQARYYVNAQWDAEPIATRQEARLSVDWAQSAPLAPPFGVEWEGVLRVPGYGTYTLGVRSPAEIKLWLDESLVLDGSEKVEGQFQLAKGNHALRFRATIPKKAGQTILYWKIPGGAMGPIPANVLYTAPVSSNGLLGIYYHGDNWQGQPALQQIDPSLRIYFHNTPLPRPYTVEWVGKLAVSRAGLYRFGLECIGDTWLYLDEKLVLEAHEGNRYEESDSIPLAGGFHDVRVRYADRYGHSHINLFWTPPGGQREIIPPDALFPPRGDYPEAAVQAKPKAESKPGVPQRPTAQKVLAVWGAGGTGNAEFNQPRDVAVDSAGNVYVADTGNARIVKLDGEGNVLMTWGEKGDGDAQFIEPLALVVDSQDNVWVLDSDPGTLQKFSSEGELLGKWGGADLALYHARGMGIDAEDNIYIADTGGGRVLKLSPNGERLAQIGRKGEVDPALLQPTDVSVAPNGDVYAADSETSALQVYDSSGLPLARWSLPSAGSVNGQHLAVVDDGSLYVTAPNDHLVLHFSADGELLGEIGGQDGDSHSLDTPVGVYIDAKGNVYIADPAANQVRKLGP